VQKDVEELKAQVSKYSGNSRKDKEYIYLDEMLTRNLLKLDDIDTEGKEDVRQVRKDAIRTIQRCISCLEGKAPLPEENKEPAAEETAMDIGTEGCQATGAEESVPVVAAAAEAVMEVPPTENAAESSVVKADEGSGAEAVMEVLPTESATESSVAKADEGTEAEAKNAAPAVSEHTREKVEEVGAVEPAVEEQKMEVAQTGNSAEVKPGTEQIPMEVDEHKQNVEKPPPVSKTVQPKRVKICGKNIKYLNKGYTPLGKTEVSASGGSDKVPTAENTDSKVDVGEAPLASQPQVEKTS
jgi:hypothetical protein